MIQHTVTMPQKQFEELPLVVAQQLARYSKEGYGFKFVLRETGEEVADGPEGESLETWLMGVMALVWPQAVKTVGEEGRGTY